MQLRQITLAVALAAAVVPSYGQETAGFGVYHCTDILLEGGNGAAARTWALGYLSGMNLVWTRYAPDNVEKNPLGKVKSPSAIYNWLTAYCQRHAQATLAPALQTYFVELSGLTPK